MPDPVAPKATDPILPDWDPSEGPPLPTDVAAVEVEEIQPVEDPSPWAVDWNQYFDQPPSVRIEGPRKIVVEPAESFNSISQLENPEEVARSLPERLDETPTAEEMAY